MGRGGSGGKKRREFLCLLPNAGGGQEPDRVRHDRLVLLYVHLFVHALCRYAM